MFKLSSHGGRWMEWKCRKNVGKLKMTEFYTQFIRINKNNERIKVKKRLQGEEETGVCNKPSGMK